MLVPRNFFQGPRYVTCALAGLGPLMLVSLRLGPSLSVACWLASLRAISLRLLLQPRTLPAHLINALEELPAVL